MSIDEPRAEQRAERERVLQRSLPSWRTRRRRTAAAIAACAVAIAGAVLAHLAMPIASVLVRFVLGAVPMVLLRIVTRAIVEGGAQLDEHDRGLRDRAFRLTYPTGGAALLVGAYVTLTQVLPDLATRTTGMLVWVAWLAWSAPTLALAMTLPDDDPTDPT